MYALGHYGVALLVYAPVGFLLARRELALAVLCGAGVLALATVPDYDLRLPLVSHRGITHTLLFALAVAGLLGAVGWRLGRGQYAPFASPVQSAAFCFGIGLLGIGSHILGDVLTPAGVTVLWPLSDHSYSVALTRADDTLANWGLFALGVLVTAGALLLSVQV